MLSLLSVKCSEHRYFIIAESCIVVAVFVQVFREIVVKGVDTSQFETKQVFYASKDKDGKCQVPMFIVHRKVTFVVFWLILLLSVLSSFNAFKSLIVSVTVAFVFFVAS